MYKKGQDLLINDNKLKLKNIQTFTGRDGIGASANIYFEGKKCGTFLDEANGGEYFIDWNYNCSIADNAWKYLMSLPKFSRTEWLDSVNHRCEAMEGDDIRDCNWKWYWCDVFINDYLLKKDMNNWLRKVVIFNTKTKSIDHYKAPKSDLNKTFRFKEGVMSGREYFGGKGIILNDLPKEEAFSYFDKYCN
tara:strand:+ start:478 stop:1050 length:573 start_codon:yes stop_codon:yes gene_type:complete